MKAPVLSIILVVLFLMSIPLALGQQNTNDGGGIGGLCCCLGQLSMFIAPFILAFGALGVWGVFVILYFLFIIYGLYSCLTKDDWVNPSDKIAWVLAILFLPFIGTIIFLIYNRKKTTKKKT